MAMLILALYSLRGANILLMGLGGLGAEIAKNLTLAGIKSLTIVDHRATIPGSANFLVPLDAAGKNVSSPIW